MFVVRTTNILNFLTLHHPAFVYVQYEELEFMVMLVHFTKYKLCLILLRFLSINTLSHISHFLGGLLFTLNKMKYSYRMLQMSLIYLGLGSGCLPSPLKNGVFIAQW